MSVIRSYPGSGGKRRVVLFSLALITIAALIILPAAATPAVTPEAVPGQVINTVQSAEDQQAVSWFIRKYGDPRINNDQPARFIEPLVTSGIDQRNLPVDKIITFPVNGGSVYFFMIYDNFRSGDPITVSWTYLENGKVVTTVNQPAGGDFGRFVVEFQRPDSGWGKGRQRITVRGNGAAAEIEFIIGDSLRTTPLPYTPVSIHAGNLTVVHENVAVSRRVTALPGSADKEQGPDLLAGIAGSLGGPFSGIRAFFGI